MNCKPCRVTYEGTRYQIERNGDVRQAQEGCLPVVEPLAKLVRSEAARQRRNRNRRDHDQAMRDLGLVRATGGAFGGWE